MAAFRVEVSLVRTDRHRDVLITGTDGACDRKELIGYLD
jgi:hypothetical protein